MKRLMLLCISVFMALQISCSDGDLQKVSKSMVVVSTAMGELQKNVIAANRQNLLNDNATGQILQFCIKINTAGKQVDAVLRSIDQLDPGSRRNLIALLIPIVQALDPTQLEFLAEIKDPATKQKIDGAFILMRTTISSMQIILASGGG